MIICYRSAIAITDEHGVMANVFRYGPFGEVHGQGQAVQSHVMYRGQFGVMHITDAPGMYLFGSRLYNVQHGRFNTLDRSGIFCLKNNHYTFAANNPLDAENQDDLPNEEKCVISQKGKLKITFLLFIISDQSIDFNNLNFDAF